MKRYNRRSGNILFVIFRLILSMTMFIILLVGLYSAYKSFSGLDPLKLNPASILINLQKFTPPQISKFLPFPVDHNSNPGLESVLTKLGGESKSALESQVQNPNARLQFSFIIVTDSHSDNSQLSKALQLSGSSDPLFLIGLGDYTEVGTIDEFIKAKSVLDSSSLRYFLLPGDHDLWDSRDKSKPASANFSQIFGPGYQSFSQQNYKFILLFNSDNYTGVDSAQMDWLRYQLESAKNEGEHILIFLHQPLFHPSSDHVMGRIEPKLKDQARELIRLFTQYGVRKVFAGDAHIFSEYSDPETGLAMVTVGAITAQRNLQLPRFARVWVYEDGGVKVEDVEIE